MTLENSNLDILQAVTTTVESLAKLLGETLKDARHYWEVTRVSYVGPTAEVGLYVPHGHTLSVASVLTYHSEFWEYGSPLKFHIATFSTQGTVELHELPEGSV